VPGGVKAMLAEKCRTDEDSVKRLLIFLAAVHDLGKATPVFQVKTSDNGDVDARISENRKRSGFIIENDMDDKPIHHAFASQVLLERLTGCETNVAVIVGAHHGKPPENNDNNYKGRYNHYGQNGFICQGGKRIFL
jgi:CRISPR-associated endonuclease/helicase Cas3